MSKFSQAKLKKASNLVCPLAADRFNMYHWGMNKRGFTLTEVLVTCFIMGILAIVIAKVQKSFGEQAHRSTVQSELLLDAQSVLSDMGVKLKAAGDGVRNSSVANRHIMATLPANSTFIIFLSRDQGGNVGFVDVGDVWSRYDLVNGKIRINTFTNTIDTTQIGGAGPVCLSTDTFTFSSPEVQVQELTFNLYTTDRLTLSPDGYQASYVKVSLWLRRKGVDVKKEAWIFLRNVHFAMTTGL